MSGTPLSNLVRAVQNISKNVRKETFNQHNAFVFWKSARPNKKNSLDILRKTHRLSQTTTRPYKKKQMFHRKLLHTQHNQMFNENGSFHNPNTKRITNLSINYLTLFCVF